MEAGWPIDVVQRRLVGFIPLTIPAVKVARTPGQCRRNERLTPPLLRCWGVPGAQDTPPWTTDSGHAWPGCRRLCCRPPVTFVRLISPSQ